MKRQPITPRTIPAIAIRRPRSRPLLSSMSRKACGHKGSPGIRSSRFKKKSMPSVRLAIDLPLVARGLIPTSQTIRPRAARAWARQLASAVLALDQSPRVASGALSRSPQTHVTRIDMPRLPLASWQARLTTIVVCHLCHLSRGPAEWQGSWNENQDAMKK